MKWYGVKKYTPPDESSVFVRTIYIDDECWPLVIFHVANFDCKDNSWVIENLSNYESEKHTVTHFCIPDPIEIEE